MTERERLIELIEETEDKYIKCIRNSVEPRIDFGEFFADRLIENGVIVPPVKVGDEIWVIEREDGDAIAVSCIQFLAKSKGCIIGSAWINDYDIDETLESLIEDTQAYFDCDLKVYPEADCFATEEEAKTAFEKEVRGE